MRHTKVEEHSYAETCAAGLSSFEIYDGGTANFPAFATISDVARRWLVDRSTARAIIQAAGIQPSGLFASTRYSWHEILVKIEGWPMSTSTEFALSVAFETAEGLAARLGVTAQSIRNYGRQGYLSRVEISSRVVRYHSPVLAKNKNEANSDEPAKK